MPKHSSETIHNISEDKDSEKASFTTTPEQQTEIDSKLDYLSSIAKFIGKDFDIPVNLAEAGKGWYWDFKENAIYADPADISERPLEELKFIIAHEGSHRRISRLSDIDKQQWEAPGFSFLSNAIEDPRVNNFLAESYPIMRERMHSTYDANSKAESWAKENGQSQLGFTPRFVEAGFEYIRQWRRDEVGEKIEVNSDLPEDVQGVVKDTIEAAQKVWWTYPSKSQADSGEEIIEKYAKRSLDIIQKEIWPEFQKLVDQDLQDESLSQMLSEISQEQEGGGEGEESKTGEGPTEEQREGEGQEQGEGKKGGNLPQELKDQLSQEEQQELSDAIDEAMQATQPQEGQPSPINLANLSEELKSKLQEYFDSLPEDIQQDLKAKAQQALEDYNKELSKQFDGDLLETPDNFVIEESLEEQDKTPEDKKVEPSEKEKVDTSEIRKSLESLQIDRNRYEQTRRELLPLIDQLEQDLREIFVARASHQYKSGFRSGRRIDIKRRMQEKAQQVPVVQSEAWQRRELPTEKDYAISLLVDLSGSMEGEKIDETFKAVVVLAEVLNRLSLNLEILGFTDHLYEYQKYDETFDTTTRDHISSMPSEVYSESARWNDDGWAVEQVSDRLAKRREVEKFLIVLSDGLPEPSRKHAGEEFDLSKIIKNITSQTDQKLIGLGIGPGTNHVEGYYPNSIANVSVKQMADTLAELIRQVIVNYQSF